MQKCQIPKFLFDLLWTRCLGYPSASGRPQIQKWQKNKMFLEFLLELREEIDFLETVHFQPRAVPLRLADLTPLPKNYLY
jgi:hypothetical protein